VQRVILGNSAVGGKCMCFVQNDKLYWNFCPSSKSGIGCLGRKKIILSHILKVCEVSLLFYQNVHE